MNPTPIGWRVQLCTGAALSIMAAVAVRVDVLNNWQYGLTISAELASILVLAAVAVVAVPVAASILGWSRHLRITAAICVALTVWSAINAYSTKQGAQILAAEGAQSRYEQAQADAKAAREEAATARKEAAGIAETGGAEALADLVAQSKAKLASLTKTAEERGVTCERTKACQAAETDLASLTARLGQAKAKAEALARAEKADAKANAAKAEAKAGPAEASMVATILAGQLGADANAVARYIALILTGLGIAVTQLVALLGGQAASLIGTGVKLRAAERSGRPGDAPGEDKASRGTQRAALDRLVTLILAAPGARIVSSGRKLAELEGVAASTYASWLSKWTEAGLIVAERAGNRTAIKLGKKKAA